MVCLVDVIKGIFNFKLGVIDGVGLLRIFKRGLGGGKIIKRIMLMGISLYLLLVILVNVLY